MAIPTAAWISVHTADPGLTGDDEASGGSYVRVQTMWSADDDTASSGTFVSIDLPAGTYPFFGVWDDDTAGTFDGGGALSSFTLASAGSVTLDLSAVDNGDATFTYAASVVDTSLDPVAEVDPPVEPVPAQLAQVENSARIVAEIVDTPEVMGDAYQQATSRSEWVQAPLDRILINGVDFTFYKGAAAILEPFKLIDPLLFGSGSVILPAINPLFGDTGLAANATEFKDYFSRARIKIQRVLDGDVIALDFRGFVTRVDCDNTTLRLDFAGTASGGLSMQYVTMPAYRRKQDVEHVLVDLLRDARVSAHEHAGASGVGLIRRGEADGLTIFNETLAVWAGATGDLITFTPNADGEFRKTQKPGDDDPVDFTVYPTGLANISLAQDITEQPDRVYAHGFTPQGELVTNVKVPGITQGTPPSFPGTVNPGDTGDDVIVIQYQLALHNFLDLEDCTIGDFDDATVAAVLAFKRDAGLTSLTPEVGSPAWDALWDLASLGYTLDDAREYPMSQDPRTRKWNRSANGSRIEENPDYDAQYVPSDLFIDVGGPFSKTQIRDFAASKRVGADGVWNGNVTLRSGLWRGDVMPGDAVDSSMVADRRDVNPNHKVRIAWFGGAPEGIVVYANGVEHGPAESQFLASTLQQTTMETWQAIERRREAKSNPGRAWSGHVRASQVRNDRDRQWDTTGGRIGNDVDLVSGWNEVKIPVGQAGILKMVHMQLVDPAAFALLVTAKPVPLDGLADRVPDPLSAPPPDPQAHHIVVTGRPTGGTFTITGNSNETANIGRNATAGTVRTAVRSLGGALASATVTGSAGGPWVVTMHGGTLDIDLGDNSLTGGTSPSVSITTTGPSAGDGTPWYQREDIVKWLEERELVDAWGTPKQPCGYDPGLKTDENGETDNAPTGEFKEVANTTYTTHVEPVLYAYPWVGSANAVKKGRVFYKQDTRDY